MVQIIAQIYRIKTTTTTKAMVVILTQTSTENKYKIQQQTHVLMAKLFSTNGHLRVAGGKN